MKAIIFLDMPNEYEEKRDFLVSPEPSFKIRTAGHRIPIFVVQKHAARRLHYDLRLELDGVLKSWAVPAGPSLNPDIKRLAVMVEDHPIDYASFEGVIPQGEYGAGHVIVWDNGDYSPDNEGSVYFNDRDKARELVRQGTEKGKLSFILRGHKLKGSWSLVRMKRGGNNWLFFKHKDEFADSKKDVLDDGRSVVSGRDVTEVEANSIITSSDIPVENEGSSNSPFPRKVQPMQAGSAEKPFSNRDWYFEPKLDGYRIIAALDKGKVRLLSRNGLDVTDKYVAVTDSLKKLPASQVILDGEMIALDEQGKSCFQCLQGFLEKTGGKDTRFKAAAIIYYVFDILFLDGRSLFEVPLVQRKVLLEQVLTSSPAVRLLEHFEGDGEAIFRGAVEAGLEGIVAKRKDSRYVPGERSADWLKIKATRTDEFIIGGYTLGTGNRSTTFGALLLGYYDDHKRLISAGHVGTGFDQTLLEYMKKRLDAIKTGKSPFSDKPDLNAPTTWVKPEIVVEVKFSEWTRDGKLRAPVFLRVRDDKPPKQVRPQDVRADPVSSTAEQESKPEGQDPTVSHILKQLENPKDRFVLEFGKDRLELSNLDKELWPGSNGQPGLTKRDLIVYLTRVSPAFLFHLKDRPITLSRYPDGISGEHFFQKHWNNPIPEFVFTIPLSEESKKHRQYMVCNNLPTLLWLGQIADLELHTWFSRIDPLPEMEVPAEKAAEIDRIDYVSRYPDFIIFDLDPYVYSGAEARGDEPELSRKGFALTCEIALRLKETLDGLSLASFVKTSGRTGLHVYVPILRQFDFHAAHSAAKTVCVYLEKRYPKLVTIDWAVEKRSGKVFLDYNQNVRGKTLASVYSPRPSPEAAVSTPVSWEELDKIYPPDFTILNVPDRLAKTGDLWSNILSEKHDLKELLKLG
ncbi:MAG: DNA ligase D [Dehalococcoidales bacterium]|nr:DNA ligase D [Dehalococcoidales bacterium]